MDLLDALKLFEIDSIINVNEADLKKKYRKLIKLNHPDLGGSENKSMEIISAYDILKKSIETLKNIDILSKSSTETVIISFENLIDILKGKSISYTANSKNIINISKENINRYNIIVEIRIKIEFNGVCREYTKFEVRTISDSFTIHCKYAALNLTDTIETKIIAYGKNVDLKLSNPNVNMNLTFDNRVKLKVMMERQLIDSKDGI